MASITHGFARVNGIRLHYAEAGSGDQLVLLLHGFPECWYSWRHQLAALGNSFHVVAPDMRGYNLSDKPARVEDYRIDVVVEDVVGLMDHFGAERAAVVGHDWGASVAWAVAQKYPQRVSKVAALQVPPAAVWRENMSARQFLRSWYMFFFQLPRVPEWLLTRKNFAKVDETFRDSVARKGTFSDADIDTYKEALRQPGAVTSALNYYRANLGRVMSRSGNNAPASKISVPTLFIFAEQDIAILPATARGVANHIDAPFREVRIPDSGHWVQNEAADEVNAALLEFLKS